MREILFSGFHPDLNGKETIYIDGKEIRGKWVYGDLQQNIDCYKIREQEKGINRIAKSFEVIPETVGQALKGGKRQIRGLK